MMSVREKLRQCQIDAVEKLNNGSILCGGVGSGKSRTSLAYYYTQYGGKLDGDIEMVKPADLYIITTARKRDTREWEEEMAMFRLSTEKSMYDHKVVVDSWNNIKKYQDVTNSFFIFDEQRVVGSGTWVKSFLKIARGNKWILLSATPGDTWMDYIPVFLANGFYKNRSEFIKEHVIYKRFAKFPQVDRFVNTRRLTRLRDKLLVDIEFVRDVVQHHEDVYCEYDSITYKNVMKTRWNLYTDEPIVNAAELCYTLRRIVNSDPDRVFEAISIQKKRKKVICFYNFDYELDILKIAFSYTEVAEWNGHKHQPIPEGDDWVYLVQYNAGAEGWNCIRTDTIIFFSQNYSYKVMVQAAGRIDRMNTPYYDLYYYHLKSHAAIDLAIARALKDKKKFNESKYVGGIFK